MTKESGSSPCDRLIKLHALVAGILFTSLTATSAIAAITAETITPFQETLNPGQTFAIKYKFSATAPTTAAYKVFLHIIDSAGTIRLQDDHYPTNPTTSWSDVNPSPIPDTKK